MEQTATANQIKPKTAMRWLLLVCLMLTAFAVVFIPAWHIQPFSAQTARGIEVSYWLKSWAPVITAIVAIVALVLAYQLWRARKGVLRKLALIVLFIPLLVVTWFARQNHFEWMFAPISSIAYAKAGEADFISDQDMVMAVELNGDAVAYPVRQMAYHHTVNDVVGGRPITATY